MTFIKSFLGGGKKVETKNDQTNKKPSNPRAEKAHDQIKQEAITTRKSDVHSKITTMDLLPYPDINGYRKGMKKMHKEICDYFEGTQYDGFTEEQCETFKEIMHKQERALRTFDEDGDQARIEIQKPVMEVLKVIGQVFGSEPD